MNRPAPTLNACFLPESLARAANATICQQPSDDPYTCMQVTFTSAQQGSASSLCGPSDAKGLVTLQPQRCSPCTSFYGTVF